MLQVIAPALWMLVMVAALPQLSETVYAPSLPDIATAMKTTHALAEYTLTVYLLGFAFGILFWGIVSDRIGRKPCILSGFIIFILGSLSCYLSGDIRMLMFSRVLQGLGGSVGSVLTQAICRDVFHGAALGRAYATLGTAIAIFPAIGPVLGGMIAQCFGWKNIFVFLIIVAIFLSYIISFNLPETHHKANRMPVSVLKVFSKFVQDKKVIGLGLLVAAVNGMGFSYFAEGSFYLIKVLGLTPSQFGMTFILLSVSTMIGGVIAKMMLHYYKPLQVMNTGITITMSGMILFSVLMFLHHYAVVSMSNMTLICIIIGSQMINMFAKCLITSNALSLALSDYKWCIGTASSLFGFFYYITTSLFTFGMASLHNHTFLPMPLYFLSISIFMAGVSYIVREEI